MQRRLAYSVQTALNLYWLRKWNGQCSFDFIRGFTLLWLRIGMWLVSTCSRVCRKAGSVPLGVGFLYESLRLA